MRKKFIILLAVAIAIASIAIYKLENKEKIEQSQKPIELINGLPTLNANYENKENSELDIPAKKIINNNYHIYQTFNNCGPAALSMALSYNNINVSQEELGFYLRPYQVPNGNNDDKSVTLQELADKAKEYGLTPFYRPNGNLNLIKSFIAQDIPVITRTWLKPNEDIGHYRVVKGYNDNEKILIQDDSLQGKNLQYSYEQFNIIWEKFNYEYLVLVPNDKLQIAKSILGANYIESNAWKTAVQKLKIKLEQEPNDYTAIFNLSVTYYKTGNYKKSVEMYEKIENNLPPRTLWYQIEPILSYYELGDYEKVFEITNNILNNGNRAFSELYLVRGDIYKTQGKLDLAKQQYELALKYNENLQIAKDKLDGM